MKFFIKKGDAIKHTLPYNIRQNIYDDMWNVKEFSDEISLTLRIVK